MESPIQTYAIGYLTLLNAATFLAFWHDKRAAIAAHRRIPEASLLQLALLGGSPAAFAARHLFRHKTRKQPFSTYLWLIVMIQAGLAIGYAVPIGA